MCLARLPSRRRTMSARVTAHRLPAKADAVPFLIGCLRPSKSLGEANQSPLFAKLSPTRAGEITFSPAETNRQFSTEHSSLGSLFAPFKQLNALTGRELPPNSHRAWKVSVSGTGCWRHKDSNWVPAEHTCWGTSRHG